MIFATPELKNRVLQYYKNKNAHFALRLSGSIVHKEKHLFKGKASNLSSPGVNLDTAMIITAAETVAW